eukprot:1207354-Amphidinium_carterae.1
MADRRRSYLCTRHRSSNLRRLLPQAADKVFPKNNMNSLDPFVLVLKCALRHEANLVSHPTRPRPEALSP